MADPPAGALVTRSKTSTPQHATAWQRTLIIMGFALIGLGAALWAYGTAGSLTVTTTPTAVKTPTADTTPLTVSVAKTTPLSTSNTSDTLVLGLGTLGVILILSGALFNRLTAITLPGGAALEFTAEGQAVAAAMIATKTEDKQVAHDAYEAALHQIRAEDTEAYSVPGLERLVSESFTRVNGSSATQQAPGGDDVRRRQNGNRGPVATSSDSAVRA